MRKRNSLSFIYNHTAYNIYFHMQHLQYWQLLQIFYRRHVCYITIIIHFIKQCSTFLRNYFVYPFKKRLYIHYSYTIIGFQTYFFYTSFSSIIFIIILIIFIINYINVFIFENFFFDNSLTRLCSPKITNLSVQVYFW